MPIPNEYNALISLLFRRTMEGSITWEKIAYNQLQTTINDTTIRIWAGEDDQTNERFVAFQLRDYPSSYDDNTIDHWYVEQGDSGYAQMLDFYDTVRRQVSGVSERLKSLMSYLETVDSDKIDSSNESGSRNPF
jgi:hypothetical protein